jgi:hypothetical protein
VINLSRLLLELNESLQGLTLVYLEGDFILYLDDKKSKEYSEKEILDVLTKIKPTAIDMTSGKNDPKEIIKAVKSSKFNQTLDLSAKSDNIKMVKFS